MTKVVYCLFFKLIYYLGTYGRKLSGCRYLLFSWVAPVSHNIYVKAAYRVCDSEIDDFWLLGTGRLVGML